MRWQSFRFPLSYREIGKRKRKAMKVKQNATDPTEAKAGTSVNAIASTSISKLPLNSQEKDSRHIAYEIRIAVSAPSPGALSFVRGNLRCEGFAVTFRKHLM